MAAMASSHLLLLFSAIVSTAAASIPSPPAYYDDLCVAVLLVDPSISTADIIGGPAAANTTIRASSGPVPLLRACAAKYEYDPEELVEAPEAVGVDVGALCRRLFPTVEAVPELGLHRLCTVATNIIRLHRL